MKFSVMCHFHLSNFYVDDGNVLSFILYQTSILSGPLLAATAGSFLCLIPIHNVLEQPEYWYEEFTCRMLTAGILFTVNALIRTEYWSNLYFEKRVQTYLLFIGLTNVVGVGVYTTYYYYWTNIGLFQPMPLNHLVLGTVTLIVITIISKFRYLLCKKN